MTWSLRLIGTPTAQRVGDAIPLPFERRWQLLVLLALRGDWMRRSEVAACLWPEVTRALASTNLRKALFRLRDASWAETLEADGDLLRFVVATDVDDFAAQVREGRVAEALMAHRGTLLEGFDDDANEPWSDWLRNQRERWRAAWRAAALQRLAEPVEPVEGLALSAALLQADPLDEAALQVQLQLLASTGQAARARETYRAFAQRLQQELGVEPVSALRAAHEGLHAHTLPPGPPQAIDEGYIGRVFEQRRILELMQRPDCRLLAIVGPGGIGKTRLVRHVLQEAASLFADGATFFSLEDVDTPAAFIARLARDLGISGKPQRDEFDAVAEHLGSLQMLLVLDNFEAIALAATPLLGQLLERAPRLKLIVTSRERLALGAQWALPLDGLPCPEPEDMDRLEDFDASRLFIAAARRADPAMDPEGECAAIVDICSQVDGLPLALELAAAWTRVMRCTDIARELRQGAELLHATNPAFPARQASVEAVFEQSWRLLGGPERQALACLSVFRGGFTVEAARAVASAALPVLGALTDKSLLRKEGARLALHPLVQQFASLKLGDGAQHAAARVAHARYFHGVLAELQLKLRSSDVQALSVVDDEFENCVLAFQWLAAHGPLNDFAKAVTALTDHARHRGQPLRCLAVMLAAAAAPLPTRDTNVRALLSAHIANLQFRLDQLAAADSNAREALALTEGDVDDAPESSRVASYSHYTLGSIALARGQFHEARDHYHATVERLGGLATTRDRAIAAENLSLVEKRLGRLGEAQRLAHESLVMRRRLGEPHAIAMCLNNLASLHLQMHEPDAAGPLLAESRALCERGGFSTTLSIVMTNLCELGLASGDLAAAERHGKQAVALAQDNGQRQVLGHAHVELGIVALRSGDLHAARESIAAACAIAFTLESPALKAKAAMAFARLLHQGGHVESARGVLARTATEPTLGAAERADSSGWACSGVRQGPALILA